MRIVCTGRNGSIGQFMPDEVIGLRTRLENPVETMESELLGSGANVLIHLAALTSVQECEIDPAKAHALNVEGAVKWLRAAKQSGLSHFVHVSTAHVFRPTESAVWLLPETEPDAASVYGKTKLESERQVTREGAKFNLQVTIARVFSVIAPSPTNRPLRPGFLHADLHRRARERDFSEMRGYKNVRDFIDAESAALRLRSISCASHTPPVMHICTGYPQAVQELAFKVFREYGIDDGDTSQMFPENKDEPNFLISRPSRLEGE